MSKDRREAFLNSARVKVRDGGHVVIATAYSIKDVGAIAMSYTIGARANYNIPDMVTFALPQDVAGSYLNGLISDMREGRKELPRNKVIPGLFGEHPGVLMDAPAAAASKFMLLVEDIVGQYDDAVQLVVPDAEGRLPWDPGSDLRFQPILGDRKSVIPAVIN